jgi:high-affinity iron transporter
MFETAVVIFREGLEAFLIVAIMLAYVTNTGRFHLRKPIFAGILVAFLISVTTGWHVAELANDPIWEGSLALIAGAMVASFTIYIMRTAKTIRADIHRRLEAKAQQPEIMAEIGVFVFTILMIAREGMETALMLGAMTGQHDAATMWTGALLGASLVAVIAYLWTTQSAKINLKLFLQVTGIFLVMFAIELFIYGLHELSEMNGIPLIGEEMNMNFHIWTEVIEEPIISNIITLGLVAVPVLWLGGSFIKERMFSAPKINAAE